MSNSKKARELELPRIVAFRITIESRSSRVSDVGSKAVVDLFGRRDCVTASPLSERIFGACVFRYSLSSTVIISLELGRCQICRSAATGFSLAFAAGALFQHYCSVVTVSQS